MKKQRNKNADLESLIRTALVEKGCVIPETPAEVATFEGVVNVASTDVPERLRDPFAALEPKNRVGASPELGNANSKLNLMERSTTRMQSTHKARLIALLTAWEACADIYEMIQSNQTATLNDLWRMMPSRHRYWFIYRLSKRTTDYDFDVMYYDMMATFLPPRVEARLRAYCRTEEYRQILIHAGLRESESND